MPMIGDGGPPAVRRMRPGGMATDAEQAHEEARARAEQSWRDENTPRIQTARRALTRIEGMMALTDIGQREERALETLYEELEHAVAMLSGVHHGPDYPTTPEEED